MARKAKRKLPKSIRQAIDAQQRESRASEAIAPMKRENPILERPPDLHRPALKALPPPAHHQASGLPDGVPYSAHYGAQRLLPGEGYEPDAHYEQADAQELLQQVGASVLVTHQDDDSEARSFWITLQDDILEGVQIRITLSRGRVSARMIVASNHTMSFIRQRLPRLRERFQRRGMHIDEIEVVMA